MGISEHEVATCLSVANETRRAPGGSVVERDDDEFYRIDDYDSMPPFLVSLTSPSNHWTFLSTTGGITAGRRNADHALFPYATSDRVADSASTTGSITIVLVEHGGRRLRWEPFSRALDGIYDVRRSVEKNVTGNIITFEERNLDLGLTFRQTWTNSPRYGIVRRCSLRSDTSGPVRVTLLDGVQNTLPALTTAAFQGAFSNLLDAYKRNELLTESGLGVFGLSAVPTDTAEPSEALAATTWWQSGLEAAATLLSSRQLDRFRRSGEVAGETDVKGKRGAYIVVSELTLAPDTETRWLFCGEVDQAHADVVALDRELRSSRPRVAERVLDSVAEATTQLRAILARNDGIQATGNAMTRIHHASNVTYNVMRGGFFAYDYDVPTDDFRTFVGRRNRHAAAAHADFLASLPETIRVDELRERADALGDPSLTRLTLEYLPLTFSRRHGDPSRPWNAFSIETETRDGSARLAYQGNWRDIFQNWEALLRSSPLFVVNVIAKFLNATTIDGYNPYRVTDEGIDWERPDPESPWANIGYWGDHQIVYLQKLLELAEDYLPGALEGFLARPVFSFADVPYMIASFDEMLQDPYNTITFDTERDRAAMERYERIGGDGKLLHGPDDDVVHASMVEKLLLLALAKASNLVPDGGIWMNTQRPEWNDANNALVGKGVSVVTTAYLERFASFVQRLLTRAQTTEFVLFEETHTWMEEILKALRGADEAREGGWTPASRLAFMRSCAEPARAFRERVFGAGLSGKTRKLSAETVSELFGRIRQLAAETVERNRRSDGLFHSYNTLSVERDASGAPTGVSLLPLYEMLEGQVAAISSHAVGPAQAERTLESVRSSALYRDDQHSYMLYPNRELPGFMERNVVPAKKASESPAVGKLLAEPDQTLVVADVAGAVHFDPDFRNAGILRRAARDYLEAHPDSALTDGDIEELAGLYEETFQHQYFTGRSGTFFGYEGLGSIYWHMVSKLLLATQENVLSAHRAGDDELARALRERYFDIRGGIGFNKEPADYGAFPMDPYSHTPWGDGAKQPGMTGQVKEEIIARFAELGLLVNEGRIEFDPFLVQDDEFAAEPLGLTWVDPVGAERSLDVEPGSFAYTFCQTPIVVSRGGSDAHVVVHRRDGGEERISSLSCPAEISRGVFDKSGAVDRIDVVFAEA